MMIELDASLMRVLKLSRRWCFNTTLFDVTIQKTSTWFLTPRRKHRLKCLRMKYWGYGLGPLETKYEEDIYIILPFL